ncbi:hypothetical protein D3C81_2236720 [compost metagenome]
MGYPVQLCYLGLHIADICLYCDQSDRIPETVDDFADNGIGITGALQIGRVRLGSE